MREERLMGRRPDDPRHRGTLGPERTQQEAFVGSDQHARLTVAPGEDVFGNVDPETIQSEVDAALRLPPSPNKTADDASVIDSRASVSGTYVSERPLRINGRAQGAIECQAMLIVGPQAKVRSRISARDVIIDGEVEGDIDCGGRVVIGASGRVTANIRAQVLVVCEGGHWHGTVTLDGEVPTRPSSPARASGARSSPDGHVDGRGSGNQRPGPTPSV